VSRLSPQGVPTARAPTPAAIAESLINLRRVIFFSFTAGDLFFLFHEVLLLIITFHNNSTNVAQIRTFSEKKDLM
jgi:hypothetical protein